MRVKVISAERNNWGINTTVLLVATGVTLTVNVDPQLSGTTTTKLLSAIADKQAEETKITTTETELRALIGKETEIGVARAEPVGD